MKNYKISLSLDQANVIQKAISKFDEIGRGDIYHGIYDIAISKFCKYNKDSNCVSNAMKNFDSICLDINDKYTKKFSFKKDYENKIEELIILFDKICVNNIKSNNRNIILNDDQVQLLSYICNYICRIYMGDLRDVADTLATNYLNHQNKDPYKEDFNEFIKQRNQFEIYTHFIEMYFFNLSSGSNYGVGQDDDTSYYGTFLFDCHQVLRHQLYIDNPENNNVKHYTVDSYPAIKHTPSTLSIGKKLIKIEEVVK